ncbi:helix-turn-helix domain-containing protein [Mesorhizobium sp. M0184]|uniref:helix-turn-helix domain-containing protein n=1 Tax=Mesorhizobium sp. M0184 TaxID=2956906 RepID=UPI003336F173
MGRRSRVPRVAPRTASKTVRRLFAILRERRIAQADFAAAIDYSTPGVAYWKSGRTEPRITDLEAALSVLGLELQIVESKKETSL